MQVMKNSHVGTAALGCPSSEARLLPYEPVRAMMVS